MMRRLRLRAQQGARRRSAGRWAVAGGEIRSSKHRKLAQERAAAEVSRRECRRRGKAYNLNYLKDFAAHELQRASASLAMVERRSRL